MIKKIDKNAVRVRKHARVREKLKGGTAETPRLCVYRSNKNIEAQVIDDVKGVTLASSSSEQLHLEHGNNIAAAKITNETAMEILRTIARISSTESVSPLPQYCAARVVAPMVSASINRLCTN